MHAEGVLLLSHCGYSFMEDLMTAVRARGLKCYVLSSLPQSQDQDRLGQLAGSADWLSSAQSHSLTAANVDHALDELEREGQRVLCCMSVWEGYRDIVARANERLGAPDISSATSLELRDKLTLRRKLQRNGLSKIRAIQLMPQNLGYLRQALEQGERYFLKPRRGIASYGAFALRANTTWEQLEKITLEVQQDVIYRDIMGSKPEYIAEDYIDGKEYSFEVIAGSNKRVVVAIHEKLSVTQSGNTMLEDGCVSPPRSLSVEECTAAVLWLDKVGQALGLSEGCFHIEAKFSSLGWEIIEINPRVGGSLISASVGILSQGPNLLDMWLSTLLGDAQSKFEQWAFDNPSRLKGTLFRVFFAQPGRITKLAIDPNMTSPLIQNISLHQGDVVEQQSREVFAGQMLWTFDPASSETDFENLLARTRTALTVESQPSEAAFLIIDYNLSRVDDVQAMAQYLKVQHGLRTILIRENPQAFDRQLVDDVIDARPRNSNFIATVCAALNQLNVRVRGGVVFSDDAVQAGAALLETLGVSVDASILADAALSKIVYREREQTLKMLCTAQGIYVPAFQRVTSLTDVASFLQKMPDGVVVKPSCEGNNRGVIVIHNQDELLHAAPLLAPYAADGIICEEYLTDEREFSYDGVGGLNFLTEKISAGGRYPVEYGQIVPAQLHAHEEQLLFRAGIMANVLVGQRQGPFHNELRLSNDGRRAAIVEPNRRPAGMRIWHLARAVYGVDIFEQWIEQSLGMPIMGGLPGARGRAACLMLGSPQDGVLRSAQRPELPRMLETILRPALQKSGLLSGACHVQWLDFRWMAPTSDQWVRAVPQDNGDFLACLSFHLSHQSVDIHAVLNLLQDVWQREISAYINAQDMQVAA